MHISDRGWGNPQPYAAKAKLHYFKDGRSLCGKWRYNDNFALSDDDDDNADNCIVCKRKVMKIRSRQIKFD